MFEFHNSVTSEGLEKNQNNFMCMKGNIWVTICQIIYKILKHMHTVVIVLLHGDMSIYAYLVCSKVSLWSKSSFNGPPNVISDSARCSSLVWNIKWSYINVILL